MTESVFTYAASGLKFGRGASAEIGWDAADVDDLAEGALQQHRLLATAPIDVTAEDLATVFRGSLEHW